MMDVPLTVVMPAYNETAGIESAVREVQQYVLDPVAGVELIVVNDGSGDRTGELLDEMARQDTRIRVVHQANVGHGPALWTGLQVARGAYIFLIDSDRQIPLDTFGQAWNAARACDGILGIRAERQDPAVRLWISSLLRRLIALFFGVHLRDANVPYKLFRSKIWEEARPLIPRDTLTPSLFLAIFMQLRRYDIVEQPVPHRPRMTGVVSIRGRKLFKFCLKAFGQMLAFRRRLKHASQ